MIDGSAKKIIVVGGGPAGMFAAIYAARYGAQVTLIERNERLGLKLGITGKGRCNVTNDCTEAQFLQNVPTNPRFLYSALSAFSTQDAKDFFEEAGVALKVERGRRVFPTSDKARDIVQALIRSCSESGVSIEHGRVRSLIIEDGAVCGVLAGTSDGARQMSADAVIVATGGCSYPKTGSDGDGYAFARQAGHNICKIRPSLVPLTSSSRICRELQGLSLKNVSLTVLRIADEKKIYEDFGEMMFTHFGITGPMVLSASAHIPDVEDGGYEARINLKPALDAKTLDARLLSDFQKYSNKDFINALGDLLPQKLIPVAVELSCIDARKKVNTLTREERQRFGEVLGCIRIPLSGTRPISEAIITKGGVDTKEVSPKTLESKLCRGLYFCGEVLDLDAYTGGYNLQIAYSTGVLAGESAAMS